MTAPLARLIHWIPIAFVAATVACSGAHGDRVAEALPDRCAAVTRAEPRFLVVDLPGVEKARLQQAAAVGVTAVRFNGCTLEVVTGCTLPGRYQRFATSRAQDVVHVRTEAELSASLPFAVASFRGSVNGMEDIDVQYVAAGMFVGEFGEARRDRLQGACQSATHVVASSVFGAYRLTSGAGGGAGLAAEVTLVAGVPGVGAGVGYGSASNVLRAEGDVARCLDPKTPAEDPACAALIQLELVPVAVAAPQLASSGTAGAMTSPALAPASSARPISDVPLAAEHFRKAQLAWRDGRNDEEYLNLRAAVAADPTAAAAQLWLALETFQGDPKLGKESYQLAHQYRDRLSARDRALLQASEPYFRPRSDLGEWERRLKTVSRQFPDDVAILIFLGVSQQFQGRLVDAGATYARAATLDPSFVPAWWLQVQVQELSGNFAAARATAERCGDASATETACLSERARMLRTEGPCSDYLAVTRLWTTREPGSAGGLFRLAEALAAVSAPSEGVEDVLRREWAVLPASMRAAEESRDRASLALLRGDFNGAVALARKLADLVHEDPHVSAQTPALYLLFDALEQAGRMKEAGDAAEAFSRHAPGLDTHSFDSDWFMPVQRILLRAGRISPSEFGSRRQSYITTRLARAPTLGAANVEHHRAMVWVNAWAAPAETPADARAALDALPPYLPLPGIGLSSLEVSLAIGKVFALADRPIDALPHLQRVGHSCGRLTSLTTWLAARYYAGIAYQASGNLGEARRAFGDVLAAWGAARPRSVLAESAKARLAGLR